MYSRTILAEHLGQQQSRRRLEAPTLWQNHHTIPQTEWNNHFEHVRLSTLPTWAFWQWFFRRKINILDQVDKSILEDLLGGSVRDDVDTLLKWQNEWKCRNNYLVDWTHVEPSIPTFLSWHPRTSHPWVSYAISYWRRLEVRRTSMFSLSRSTWSTFTAE